MKETQKAIFLIKWKETMKKSLEMRFNGDGKVISEKKLNAFLDKMIERKMKNFNVDLVNNYRGKVVHTDFLSLIDHIEKHELIMGGGATIFLNHDMKDNPIIYFLIDNIEQRNAIKAHNKTLPEGSFEALMGEYSQLNKKLLNNTFYGGIGNPYFRFHNIFIAEAITMLGRNIISTAAIGFEGFFGDNVYFNEIDEVYQYIININDEYFDKYTAMDLFAIPQLPEITNDMVVTRILNKCEFSMDDNMREALVDTITGLSAPVKLLLYYKNNLYEFLRIPTLKDKLAYILQTTDVLMAPDVRKLKNEECATLIMDIWDLLEVYVFYNHPVYDRIRKTMYTSKKSVYYIDTDSNFLALNPFVKFAREEILENKPVSNLNDTDLDFTIVNIITVYLSEVVKINLHEMARKMKVPEVFVPYLKMKNEFYFKRIIFTDRKKRYIALKILREGRLLNDGNGTDELKGFDFKKSVTKPTTREFYTNLCMDEILRTDSIDPRIIFRKLMAFKAEMRKSLESLESTYYRQAAIQMADHYKHPYSDSGYKSLVLWNALCPNYAMEPPVNVDIVPIKDLSNKRNMEMLRVKYPETYELLDRKIFNSQNELVRGMALNYIALPRGMDYEIPAWLPDVLDIDSIIDANLKMIISLTNSVGLTALVKGKSGTPHISNIISI